MFDVGKLERLMPGFSGLVEYSEVMASTSDRALDLARGGAVSGTLVLAEEQTKGRGRRDGRWFCGRGEGLLFSVVLEPDVGVEYWGQFGLVAGVAVAEALEACGVDVWLKWPNDIWLAGGKCAGVLVEVAGGRVVVGIGVNLSSVDFPEEVRGKASSVLAEGGVVGSREEILASILQRLLVWGSRVGGGFSDVVREVEKRSLLTGRMVRLVSGGEALEGRVVGLSELGGLLVDSGGVLRDVFEGHGIKVVG